MHIPIILGGWLLVALSLNTVAQPDEATAKRMLWLDGVDIFPYTGKLLLAQNVPNPVATDQATTIGYRVADGAPAAIIVYNASREPVLRFERLTAGNGQVVIGAGQLAPGAYTYVLLVQGRQVQRRSLKVYP